jgi:hypothetical protein
VPKERFFSSIAAWGVTSGVKVKEIDRGGGDFKGKRVKKASIAKKTTRPGGVLPTAMRLMAASAFL